MKKNCFLLIFTAIFAYQGGLLAQVVSSYVQNNYPTGVIAQVFDIVEKTDLDVSKQTALADLIVAKDEAVAKKLHDGIDYDEIVKARTNFEGQINDLLNSDQQYYNFVGTTKEKAKYKYTYSQFAIAIRYKDSLGLKQGQVDSLLFFIDTLKQIKNEHYQTTKQSLDTRAFESREISEILKPEQYGLLLIIKNQDKARAFAQSDWEEITQRGLDSTITKEEALGKLTNYYLARECTYNRYQHELVKQKLEIRDLYIHRPQVLRILEHARRNPENNTLGSGFRW